MFSFLFTHELTGRSILERAILYFKKKPYNYTYFEMGLPDITYKFIKTKILFRPFCDWLISKIT